MPRSRGSGFFCSIYADDRAGQNVEVVQATDTGSALGRVTQPDDHPPLCSSHNKGQFARVKPQCFLEHRHAVGCQNLLDNSCVIIGAEKPGRQRGKPGTQQKQVAIQAVSLLGGGAQVCDFLLADFPANGWPG